MELLYLIGLIMLGLLALVFAVLFLSLWLRLRRQAKAQAVLGSEVDALRSEAETLRPLRAVRDAASEAQRLKSEADVYATMKRAEADSYLHVRTTKADGEATRVLTEAREAATQELSTARAKAKELREQADAIVASAAQQSKDTVEAAKQRAQDIAGEAWTVKENAERYAKAARAMKHMIEGYGDEWVVPTDSLLDDLAEEYSHTQAGVDLKHARLHTKSLVTSGHAADCDYVEQNRRQTAIQFVLDAFNGKVDSILVKVKHTNYGKLSQQIKDSFDLVNHLGSAFRNARITQEYFEARLAELRLAVVVQELQVREREEQARIRQAIREEEQARREYERASKEAEKEERMLQKAMQKAREKLEAASAEERALMEQQLAALEERLQAAEEKNQRALSMAQQTRRGHVYVISNVGSFGDNVLKIGLTRRLEPLDRVRELGDASVPFAFDVHAMIFSDDAPALETALHHHFAQLQVNRVNPRKEFFRVTIAEVRKIVERMDLQAHWTMTAEAREFRETMAVVARERLEADKAAGSAPQPEKPDAATPSSDIDWLSSMLAEQSREIN